MQAPRKRKTDPTVPIYPLNPKEIPVSLFLNFFCIQLLPQNLFFNQPNTNAKANIQIFETNFTIVTKRSNFARGVRRI